MKRIILALVFSVFSASPVVAGLKAVSSNGVVANADGNTFGLPQVSDTSTGFSYSSWFAPTPTIYYCPAATTSKNLGTYNNPYTTAAAVQTAVTGDMAGQTLGICRGSVSTSLSFSGVYGASGTPFNIVPYGNGALPIISSGVKKPTWTSTQTNPQVWQVSTSGDQDIFEYAGNDYHRLWGVSGASQAAIIAAINSYIASPELGTYGAAGYYNGVLYIYLNDGTNPNAVGNMYLGSTTSPLVVTYADVANTGYINIVGLNAILGGDGGALISVTAADGTSLANVPTAINVVGNVTAHGGTQFASSNGQSGILLYGGNTASYLLTNSKILGNYGYDQVDSPIVTGGTTGLVIEYNVGSDAGGNSIWEAKYRTVNSIVEFNRGYNDPYEQSRVYTSYHGSCFWLTGLNGQSGSVDITTSTGNVVAFNYCQDYTTWGIDNVPNSTSIYNNTFVVNNLLQTSPGQALAFEGGSSATGTTVYNNLEVLNAGTSAAFIDWVRTFGTGTPNPTLDYNAYVGVYINGNNHGAWSDQNGGGYFTLLSAWQTETSGESHSYSTGTSNNLSPTQAAFNTRLYGNGFLNYSGFPYGTATDYYLSVSSSLLAVGKAITGSPTWDGEGYPVITAMPNIGCYQGAGT